jgi:transmembrane sensor
MSDSVERAQALGRKAQPEWTPERAVANELGMVRRRARRRRLRAGLAVGMASLVLTLGTLWLRHAPGETRYADGSHAHALSDSAALHVSRSTRDEAVTEIDRGGYRFSVVPNPKRTFRVIAGGVRVEVLGTEFAVERLAAEQVRVQVWSGRVRVLWQDQARELTANADQVFPPATVVAPAEAPTTAAPAPVDPPTAVEAAHVHPPHVSPAWVKLAQAGDYDAAYAMKHRSHDLAHGAVELMLAADAARLSHHPDEALEPLRMLVEQRARDPRAPLAAFTLGRVLLDDLGRPREASAAFAKARELAPQGPLSEDALAREVEAWSRSGETVRAHEQAQRYLDAYPTGARARSVRRFGNVE